MVSIEKGGVKLEQSIRKRQNSKLVSVPLSAAKKIADSGHAGPVSAKIGSPILPVSEAGNMTVSRYATATPEEGGIFNPLYGGSKKMSNHEPTGSEL